MQADPGLLAPKTEAERRLVEQLQAGRKAEPPRTAQDQPSASEAGQFSGLVLGDQFKQPSPMQLAF